MPCWPEGQDPLEKNVERKQLELNASRRDSEVVTFAALLVLLGRRSRQSVYDLMRRDPSFPRPRQLGSPFSIGWLREEVMEWLSSCPRVELNGLDAIERRRDARARGGDREPAM
jgi:predicted DNA-binding transcriptional regulator AlpA